MNVTVLGQPDRNAASIAHSLNEALEWHDATRAWFAVAWAKRSGLLLLEQAILRLRAKGKSVRALIGIDQHGGTEEALRLALRLFSEARVYHDTAPFRTFHPKFYIVEGRQRARVIVGSGNLTEGGLSTNYEVAVSLDLNVTDATDAALLDDFRNWFKLRWATQAASRKLTGSLVTRLLTDPTVVVVPEDAVPRPLGARQQRGMGGPVFGTPVRGLRSPRRKPAHLQLRSTDRSDIATPADARPGRTMASTAPRATSPTAAAVTSTDLVLAAGLPKDRHGQAGFNADVAAGFFGVTRNGDQILAEALDRRGKRHGMRSRQLVFPAGSNRNHRFEMRDPEGRRRPSGVWPVILVRTLGSRRFEYLYLYPSDRGYSSMRREIRNRAGVGRWRKPETKRVYLTLGEVRRVWPGCPF